MNIKKLAEDIKKVSPFPDTPLEIFFALRKLLPMLAIELFVVNKNGAFVLVQKKSQSNDWALPGAFLGLNEDLEVACQRIAKKYFGTKVSRVTFLNFCNLQERIYGKDKGHVVVLIFKCILSQSVKNVTYFKKIPKEILSHHKVILNSVFSHIKINKKSVRI